MEQNVARHYLYLIRHGQYNLTGKHKLGGKLTHIGQVQAEFAAKALRVLPISTIYASTLRRAAETADIIAREFPDIPMKRTQVLWECVPMIPPRFANHFARIAAKDPDFTTEYVAQQRAQAEKAFTRYFKPLRNGEDKHELLICHGNIMRFLVCRAMAVDPDAWGNLLVNHCGISRIVVESDGSMFLLSHNDVGHMPTHLWTEM
jgi:serine/threonine-protein phosphatase PGAM5